MLSATASVGAENSIELPIRDGIRNCKEIAKGSNSTVHEICESQPKRVYKMISFLYFNNGDEIRAARKAAELGVGPAIHDVFIVNNPHKFEVDESCLPPSHKYVVIEMDHVGECLYQRMGDFAAPDKENPLVEISEAVEKIYGSQARFYFGLFSQLKVLAEAKISYRDTHTGNIMPNTTLQLIDYGESRLHETPEAAARESLRSIHNDRHYQKFVRFLSGDNELVLWWQKYAPKDY